MVMIKKLGLIIGLSRIPGVLIGVIKDSSKFKEETTCVEWLYVILSLSLLRRLRIKLILYSFRTENYVI